MRAEAMRIGVPKEVADGETRVALVPDSIGKLSRLGLEVTVEHGAGLSSGFTDEAYAEKGATLGDRAAVLGCELVLSVSPLETRELKQGGTLVCMADPLGQPKRIAEFAAHGLTCFSLELMPRISRAQAMDVLSSMANVAGYKAVLLAAARSPKMFPLMMTAAGTVRPAKVFVLGAGVAGLQAIATARRLGAVVEAYDIRAATKTEVESLGARFVEFDLGAEDAQDEGGYAKELTDEQKAKQAELMAQQIQGSDVVITTAQVPGRRAPRLITASVVQGMKPGSVIVDMAADSGGNCECTQAGEDIDVNGVTVLGPCNLPASVCVSTSQLYSNNLVAFLRELVKDGELQLESLQENEVLREPLVCRAGEVTNERVREALS